MKLHLCCGDIYLKGYVNIDIYNDKTATPVVTTLDEYYKRPIKTNAGQRSIVADKCMDVTQSWEFENDSIDEILMICGIEHFTRDEASHIIDEAYRVLKNGGCFSFDFPDIWETVDKYYKEDPNYMARLLYGSGKNIESIHKWGYTPESIEDRLTHKYQWRCIRVEELVKHEYPMIGIVAVK